MKQDNKIKKGLYTFLNKNGEVVNKPLREIKKGLSWDMLNTVVCDYCTKKEAEFLKMYGLERTIFNVASLQKYGYIHLYPHYIKVVLEHGAIDKRGLE